MENKITVNVKQSRGGNKTVTNHNLSNRKMDKCPKCGKKFLTKREFITCCYCGQQTGVEVGQL